MELKERVAYRTLMRISRVMDKDPIRKGFLIGLPPRRFDVEAREEVLLTPGRMFFVDEAVRQVLGGTTEYASTSSSSSSTCAAACKHHWQCVQSLGFPYLPQATALLQRFEMASNIALRLGAASPTHLEEDENMGFSPAFVLNCADEILDRLPPATPHLSLKHISANPSSHLRVGDLLVAHPLARLSNDFLDRAVVVIIRADQSGGCVQGLVVNKPCRQKLEQLVSSGHAEESDSKSKGLAGLASLFRRDFGMSVAALQEQEVFQGGPSPRSGLHGSLFCLHSHSDVPDCSQVAHDLFLNGCPEQIFRNSLKHVLKGMPLGMRFFYGSLIWSHVQLQIELELGTWIHVRSNDLSELGRVCLSDEANFRPEYFWQLALTSTNLPILGRIPRGPAADLLLTKYIDNVESLLVHTNRL